MRHPLSSLSLILVLASCGDSQTGVDRADLGPPDLARPAPPDLSADARPPERRYDWIGIVGTGQSLSVGAASGALISTTQPYHNLKLFDNGPAPRYPIDGKGGDFSLVPLVEPIRPRLDPQQPDGQYPNNIFGETPHSGMANQISAISLVQTGFDFVTVHSVVGWSGNPLVNINKAGGKLAYPATLAEARTIKKLAQAAGKKFAYGAIVLTHGESDSQNGDYGKGVYQLYLDYNQDLKAITGQAEDIPLLVSQQSTLPGDSGHSLSSIAVWQLGVQHPGQVLCTGPKYQYVYAGDRIHLDAANYLRLGEKYAQVFYQHVVQKIPWKPLQPHGAMRTGANITIDFDVPVPPLGWDDTLSPPHQASFLEWKNGRGFEAEDETGRLTIKSVEIQGDAVAVHLDKEPAGKKVVVRYAMTQDDAGLQGGYPGGKRGQLRDSDGFVGYDAETIPCQVEKGSKVVKAKGAFTKRSARDPASGGTLPAGTLIQTLDSADQATLSQPWTGDSGTASLTFHHDQHNYAVHFELPVP